MVEIDLDLLHLAWVFIPLRQYSLSGVSNPSQPNQPSHFSDAVIMLDR